MSPREFDQLDMADIHRLIAQIEHEAKQQDNAIAGMRG